MREEYHSVLSTPIETDNIGRFDQYRYIGETQILADISARAIYRSISNTKFMNGSQCFHREKF